MSEVVLVDDFAPVIDLSSRNTADGRAEIAEAIGRSCRRSGFFTIVGHGVPPELVERMYRTTNGFFTLPEAEKARSASVAGVSGLRKFKGDGDIPGLYEAFAAHVTGDLPEDERNALGDYPATWKVANLWPESPADFRATWHEYMAAMTELSEDVMRLFALALDLPETFFDAKFDRHVSLLLANFYYPQDPAAPAGMRRESHTDWGTLTILYQEDDLSGLQVLTDAGEWRDLPAVPGSFVVNIGDLMAFWTGGRWASTVHRVISPEHGRTRSRVSIPFFHLPNHDTSIEPVGGGFRGEGEPEFERVTVGQWFSHKMKQTFAPELPEQRAG
ncbi:MAG: isopenicillin N synthase family oxygenase [Saccharothrix sp.]|nr:isopenicillin N synthase family oxygenase [Saccharothrix sp.]